MAKKKRQRISYVLPLASTPGGHRLGVNGLSYDRDRSILYTGGRDGVICAWNLDTEAAYDPQEDKSLPATRKTSTFRQQIQAHTHWVNDLVLVKNNLAVVSASSDASVKLWRPHSSDTSSAYTIGSHSDYIKCLSSPGRGANWVASGGLDHRIKLWDLAGAGERLEIDIKKAETNKVEKGSIYALKATNTIIASGGPESVVRIWDVNSGKGITKLVGHTDNIRDILISEDGDTLLTASSDQTIKVWSITAGRCLHTLTMHNDSVWCMYSDDPTLSVFYSGDRSGLVAKTDTRRAMEIEEGTSVAVCQEHDGIARMAVTGDSIWTATSSSSINRWKDVDTELEIETPPASPRHDRRQSALSRSLHSPTPPSSPPSSSPAPTANGVNLNRIPHSAILSLSHTAIHPGRKQTERNYSVTNIRKPSEAILSSNVVFITPMRGHPEETIEGQNGLTKHVMLNDKKRVLTIDTAGEVVLWDLLECVQIKAFGRRHLDEVVPEVNKQENVANWCTIDTKTGKLTVMLEEIYCFDAELYADELEFKEQIDFREDQRINLGKWVLRNLFSTLLDEELRRDDAYRTSLRAQPMSPIPAVSTQPQLPGPGGIQRLGAPTRILLPVSTQHTPMVSPGTVLTPRANGRFVPLTPGLAIGLATPGGADLANGYSPLTKPINSASFPATIEEDATPSQTLSPLATSSTNAAGQPADYFSTTKYTEAMEGTEAPNNATTPATDPLSPLSPTSPSDDKRKSFFGKKLAMPFPKKLGRAGDLPKTPAVTTVAVEEKSEDSDQSSEREATAPVVIEDNFYGVVQRIRQSYQAHSESQPNETLPVGITPPPPVDTPVLRPPPHTLIIIQEDDPESGGLTDLYRGEISKLGHEADIVERVAPAWLGELLLRNQIPEKETVKVSFVLHPHEEQLHKLPSLTSPEGNARLNANRMLRAKKILAYVAERIDPTPAAPPHVSAASNQANGDSTASTSNGTQVQSTAPPPLKPEEYLELICQGQRINPNMTLGTLRVHVWRGGGDVVLYYRTNGKKEIRPPHPADVLTKDEGMGQIVTNA